MKVKCKEAVEYSDGDLKRKKVQKLVKKGKESEAKMSKELKIS